MENEKENFEVGENYPLEKMQEYELEAEIENLEKLSKIAGISTQKKSLKPLKISQLEEFEQKEKKKGIIYLSRIPPFMKPMKLKHIMKQFGEVGRVYMQQESMKIREKRLKHGGNRKKYYTEGWVEFLDKNIAKGVANSLNNTLIGGKKSNFYHDDIWNIIYLPKFKWNMLTERIALEKATREQKIRTEIRQSKKENAFYLENVDKSKMISELEKRKKSK
eukprot:Sdes_comp16568_c0_seq1m5879